MNKKFCEIFEDDTKNVERVSSNQYLKNGKIAIVDQGRNKIVGYTNNENYKICEEERIIFGDHTRIFKYINVPFITGADGTKVLKINDNKKYNYKYFYYYLTYSYIPNTGYNRHFKWVKELEFKVPEINRQLEIVNVLDKICSLIEERKIQIETLDKLVKSQFAQMFGNPITNEKGYPLVDFINVVKLQRGYDLPNQDRDNTGNIPVYGANGVLDKHTLSKCSTGIITGRSGTIGKVYYSFEEFWPLNTTLFSVETYGNNIIYLKHLLDMFNLKRFVDATGVPTLNRNIVHKQKIINVPIELQNQFAEFVEKIDKQKIELQKSLEELKKLQESLMDKYFNLKNGG